jgi:hypothetical protein
LRHISPQRKTVYENQSFAFRLNLTPAAACSGNQEILILVSLWVVAVLLAAAGSVQAQFFASASRLIRESWVGLRI